MKRVVVGVEDLPHGDAALGWAAIAAEQRGATLQLVHATGFPMAGVDMLADDWTMQGANALMDRAVAQARDLVPLVTVEPLIDRRRPAEVLVDVARGAELLVLGTHRMTTTERVFSGSLAYQIAAAAPVPTVVVPGGVALDAAGVVVGVDGSADSIEAVALAAAEADRTGQALHVVRAWMEPSLYASVDVYPEGLAESIKEEERLVLAESVAGLAEQYPDLVVHERLVREQPGTALLDEAEHARLLVVGSRGRHGLTRLLLGSVSHTVVLHAPCPVMIARTRHVETQHT
ncbi:universal stress protein [Actinotalea sp. M2MS4P-6]|uniref:universal stress protein n=1 Tax=Actinotalea sp. M2MS4P-6 TaxID=2983762 RepID=UPI0021E462E9|nr:universal stress protein [Actinotalea sp. M2MS4P-6]MCV2392737.1 universal stress protein [Actinotalea sp. M2MS4P-6]